MKTGIWVVAALGVFAVTCSTLAEETKPVFGVSADYLGKYVWRGQNITDDPVFQPGASVAYGPLTASIWGNIDTTSYKGAAGDISELDYTLALAGAMPGVEGVGYSLGVIYYDFPVVGWPHTTEVYGGLSLTSVPLTPSITVYRDTAAANGTYYAFGLSHTIAKIAELSSDMPIGLTAGANIGYADSSYNKFYWSGTSGSKAQDLTFNLGFPTTIAGWTVTPKLSYVTLLSSTLREADTYSCSSDYFFAGIGISRSF